MALRIFTSCVILVSILFFPFWTSILLTILAIIYFSFFWETLVLFLISDLLYSISEKRFFGITLVSTLSILILLLLTEFIKKKLKFYKK